MRKTDTSLFELIHHLTKGEKRYFKVFAKLHQKENKNALVQLFSVVEKQMVYDEEAIRKSLSGKVFTSNFSQAKADLYKLILKALRVYHHQQFSQVEVNDLLSSTEILRVHGLFPESRQVVQKIQQIGSSIEYPVLDFQLNNIFMRNSIRSNDQDQLDYWQKNYKTSQLDLLLQFQDLVIVQDCFLQIYGFLRKTGLQNTIEQGRSLQKIMQQIGGVKLSENTPEYTRYWYLMTNFFYHYCTSDASSAKRYGEMILHMFESKKHKDVTVYDHITIFASNLIQLELTSGNLKGVIHYYNKIMNIWKAYPILEQEAKYYRLHSGIIEMYMYRGELDQSLKLYRQIERKINLDSKDQHALISLLFHCIWIHLFVGQFEKVEHYLAYIVNQVHSKTSSDFLLLGRLMQLIVLIEDNNISVLRSYILSTERFLKKYKRMDESLEVLFSFFRNYSRLKLQGSKKEMFTQLKMDIRKIPDRQTKIIYRIPQILIWIEHKITGEPFETLLVHNTVIKRWS